MPKKSIKKPLKSKVSAPEDSRIGAHSTFKNGFFKKSVLAIKDNPKLFFYIFLLDLGFFAIFYLLNVLINAVIPTDPAFMTKVQGDNLLLIGIIALTLLYLVIMVLVYSFFSLIILGNIKSMSTKHEHDFSMFKRMFGLNMLLFLMFFLLLIIFNLLLGLVSQTGTFITIFVSIILFFVFLLAYAFYNFSHSALILNHEFRENLKKSFRHVFTKSYLGVFIFDFIVVVVYIALYFSLGLVFKQFILDNYEIVVNISSIVTLLLVYLLFSFNRIYFFFVAEKHIGHKKL